MADVNKIKTANEIPYSISTIYTSCTGQTCDKVLPLLDINNFNRNQNTFKHQQPPYSG